MCFKFGPATLKMRGNETFEAHWSRPNSKRSFGRLRSGTLMNCVKPSRRGSLGAGSASKQIQFMTFGSTQWTSRFFLARSFERSVTKFAPNKALK